MRNYKNVRWDVLGPIAVPDDFQASIGGDPLVARILYQRGITTAEQAAAYLDPEHYRPTPACELPGVLEASDRIERAAQNQELILIWGDFDVDGQTSTTLLVSALNQFGARTDFYIPDRMEESHGISPEKLATLINTLKPDLLLTCDTGIDALESTALARSQGVDVIITDHHQLPPELPEALSIINPNLLPESHPLYSLPGVGVAYKLIEHIFLNHDLDPGPFLDLVSLGIVADVAPLLGDTRYLLQIGLPVLRKTDRLGLLSLFDIANLDPKTITEQDIGYSIGPRLNALGRLSNANSCVDFFTTKDPDRAEELAQRLETLNNMRRQITDDIFNSALQQLIRHPELDSDYQALVLLDPSWHAGVIGIVASRLVDRFQKPVILLTREGDTARGSARSIPGIPISDMISEQAELLISHGGHPMAAGLSLNNSNVAAFRRSLSQSIKKFIGPDMPEPVRTIDAEIDLSRVNLKFISQVNRLAPFGPTNPPLLFASRDLTLKRVDQIGRHQEHRKLHVVDNSGNFAELLWWNSSDLEIPGEDFNAAYTLQESSYRGNKTAQATLRYLKSSKDSSRWETSKQESIYDVIDYRNQPSPVEQLNNFLRHRPECLVWSEGVPPPVNTAVPRSKIHTSETMVIWTIPPSPRSLQQALELSNPEKLVLFSIESAFSDFPSLITLVSGLLKYAQSHQKSLTMSDLYQKTGQSGTVIRLALSWLDLRGDFSVQNQTNGFRIMPGSGERSNRLAIVEQKLNRELQETLSYRYAYKNYQLKNII